MVDTYCDELDAVVSAAVRQLLAFSAIDGDAAKSHRSLIRPFVLAWRFRMNARALGCCCDCRAMNQLCCWLEWPVTPVAGSLSGTRPARLGDSI